MLDDLFMTILDMSKVASVAILVVLAVRLLLKRAPKVFSYALWAVVLFRLLCPFSIGQTALSLVPEITPTAETYELNDEPISMADAGAAVYSAIGDALNGGLGVQRIHTTDVEADGSFRVVTADWYDVWILAGQYVWLAVLLVLLLRSGISYRKVKRSIGVSIPLRDNIFLADDLGSPFVVGLLRPKIYLPSNLTEEEQSYIILHEQHHIRRGDHIFKVLAFIALCLHWFNPLVWVAFILAGKDMEMSCDEAVIRKVGSHVRADYSASLLTLATGRRIIAGTPLAFGEGDTKGRIHNLARWKKPARWIVILSVVLCLILSVCLLTNPATSSSASFAELETIIRCQLALADFQNRNSYYVVRESQFSGDVLNDGSTSFYYRSDDDWLYHTQISGLDQSFDNYTMEIDNNRYFRNVSTIHDPSNGDSTDSGWTMDSDTSVSEPWLAYFSWNNAQMELVRQSNDGDRVTFKIIGTPYPDSVGKSPEVTEYNATFCFVPGTNTLQGVTLDYCAVWTMYVDEQECIGKSEEKHMFSIQTMTSEEIAAVIKNHKPTEQSPPVLKITDGFGQEVMASLGTHEWNWDRGDGTWTGVCADSTHPLEWQEFLVPLITKADTIELSFAVQPQSVTVHCWSDAAWGNVNAIEEWVSVTGNTIQIQEGGYVFEVIATWTGEDLAAYGTACYGFYVVREDHRQ